MANFFSVLRHNLPSSGVAGDIWYTTDSHECFVVVPTMIGGTGLIPLNSLFSTAQNIGVGPEGAIGETGASGQGFSWRGLFQVGDNYVAFDVVFYEGGAYVCITPTVPGDLPSGPKWNLLASKGNVGSAGPAGPEASLAKQIALSIALGGI
jgi:hypothetical protein